VITGVTAPQPVHDTITAAQSAAHADRHRVTR
jgi:hypothetical protein